MSEHRLAGVLRKPSDLLDRFTMADNFWSLSAFFFIFSVAVVSAIFLLLNNTVTSGSDIKAVWPILALNGVIALGLLVFLGLRVWRAHRLQSRGVVGAQMQGRLIALFSIIAIMPSVLAVIFALVALDRGLDHWFSNHTKTLIGDTTSVADAFLTRQQNALRSEVDMMARDLSAAAEVFRGDQSRFTEYLRTQADLRGMQQALLIDDDGNIKMASSREENVLTLRPSDSSLATARYQTVIVASVDRGNVIGLRQIEGLENTYLYTVRMMTPGISEKLIRTVAGMREYSIMEERRLETQITFSLAYFILTLVTFLGSVWLGLAVAGRLVLPIGKLIQVTRRLGAGELDARIDVEDLRGNGEIRQLSETFNQMADRLSKQQSDIHERARFTEVLLAGVSSGVIGIDKNGVINHANDVTRALFPSPDDTLIGAKLAETMPEFNRLIQALAENPASRPSIEFSLENGTHNGRIIRATAQITGGARDETIITFDDITDLLTAQRNAAWADIAQRIAHEIKNPLTPIQLSAERLQTRYAKNGKEIDDIFRQCTDTIVRQVEDIGSMVDEFAAFARMPSARMTSLSLVNTVSEAILLQRIAYSDIEYVVGDLPDIDMIGDRRLISQSLTNVLKNAAEAMRAVDGERRIELMVSANETEVTLSVSDTGKGWPKENRYDLLEPYKTSRDEGTGLGLSIVKKILDDHRGKLILSDAPWCASGGTGAMLQMVFPLQPPEVVGESIVVEEM
ncbi:MAG: hypothetical protein CML78_00475 [Rhodobiaceae bacterium]|nr:hypothetical protein [Rhodobiaceae bacterium]RPF98283.1 MAG: HAMP domain-containing protein [Rhizobiales bacterium TMED162]